MGFRVFDVLFVVVLLLAAVAAAASFYLAEPYPVVIVAAFAAGAAVFLYLTVRVKLGGIVETVDRRLAEQEVEAAQHREALERSFAEIERLTRMMAEQIKITEEKNLKEIDGLRQSVRGVVDKLNGQLEEISAATSELKKSADADAAAIREKIIALEQGREETETAVGELAVNLDAFVNDEHMFREGIESRLAERVTYLEDFIREKRKSLQI